MLNFSNIYENEFIEYRFNAMMKKNARNKNIYITLKKYYNNRRNQ